MHFRRLTKKNYEEAIAAARQGVVFCFNKACLNSKLMERVIRNFSIQRRRAVIFKLDIAEDPRAMASLGVKSAPTVLIINEGQVVAAKIGFATLLELAALFDGHTDGNT